MAEKENSAALSRPNDEDGVLAEKLNHLKRSRDGFLASVTTKKNEIEGLLSNPCNLLLVRSEFEQLSLLFYKFCEAHKCFHDELQDESERSQSELYFQEIKNDIAAFGEKVNDWLESSSVQLQLPDITPGDSVSQVSRSRSGRGSRASSRTSSLSAARAEQAMKKAELHADFKAQKCRERLEREELRLKQEKKTLNLKIEFEKANAKEMALQRLEEGELREKVASKSKGPTLTPTVTSSLSPEAPVWHPQLPSRISLARPVKTEPKHFPYDVIEVACKYAPPETRFVPTVPKQLPTTPVAPTAPPMRDILPSSVEILERQNGIVREFILQQQKATLPKRIIPTFGGNPLEYRMFIQAFVAGIESKEPDSTSRLYFLDQYTTGTAKELVRSCQHMSPVEGYNRARELLMRSLIKGINWPWLM